MSKKRKVLTKQNFEDSFEEVFDHINVNSEKNAKKFAKEVEAKNEMDYSKSYCWNTRNKNTFKEKLVSFQNCNEKLESYL